MDEYTFVIQPVISLNPSPSHYEYNIKACYEIGQRCTYRRVTLDDFVEDVRNNTDLAERFQYMIKWEESYEEGRTDEKLGLAARAMYDFLESHGYDVMYKYE